MIGPNFNEFKSIITEDLFYKFATESNFPIKTISNYRSADGDSKSGGILYRQYYKTSGKKNDDSFNETYKKISLKTDKEIYDYHIEKLFNKIIVYDWPGSTNTVAAPEALASIPQLYICEYDVFISKIYRKCDISYSSSVLYQIRLRLGDPSATYELGKEYLLNLKESEGSSNKWYPGPSSYSYGINNPIFYPSIKQKKVTVSEEDAKFWEARSKLELPDAVLKVGDVEFSAHLAVLLMRSVYFSTLINSGLKESQDLKKIEIEFKIQPKNFKTILEFIYTKAIDFKEKTLEDLYEITSFAKESMNSDLDRECVGEYRRRMDSHTFWQILQVAESLDNSLLTAHCKVFLKQIPSWIGSYFTVKSTSFETLQEGLRIADYLNDATFSNAIIKEIENRKSILSTKETIIKYVTHKTGLSQEELKDLFK